MKSIKFSLLAIMLAVASSLAAQTIHLTIKDIRSNKGNVCVGVFADEAGFKSEMSIWIKSLPKSKVRNDSLQIQISVQPGKYGVSVLDDENGNGKMEYNFLGVPREGFGFSNYYHKGLRRPSFDDFSFYIEKGETKHITVKMKYY